MRCNISIFLSMSATLASICLFTSCTGSLRKDDISAPSADVAARFVHLDDTATAADSAAHQPWWQSYHDPALTHLIEHALHSAPTMRIAWARVDQAAAAARISTAALLPTLSATANVSTTTTSSDVATTSNDTYSLGLAASYELDLWGRQRARSTAAAQDAIALRADMETTAMSVSAQIADIWWRLAAQRELSLNRQAQVQAQRDSVSLTHAQQRRAQQTAAQQAQQQQTLLALRAQLRISESAVTSLELQLRLLCGLSAQTALPQTTRSFSQLSQLLQQRPHVGIPLAVLAQRPDVRAALQRVYAADARVAAATSDRLPQMTLSASAVFQNTAASGIFDNWLSTLSAGLLAPLFDGGRLKAEQRRTEALLRERLATYRQRILTAINEVERALVQEQLNAHLVENMHQQLQLGRQRLNDIRTRYRHAGGTLAVVLQEEAALLRTQQNLIEAQREQCVQRVALHRALGGHWTTTLTAVPSTPSAPPAHK